MNAKEIRERLVSDLDEKAIILQCKITSFSEYGRFPCESEFIEIKKLSLELDKLMDIKLYVQDNI